MLGTDLINSSIGLILDHSQVRQELPMTTRGYSSISPAHLLWSLGVLLSYLLTGMSPFLTEADKLTGHITLDSSVSISKSCMHLITRCLEADPNQRADIEELKAHQWLEGALH